MAKLGPEPGLFYSKAHTSHQNTTIWERLQVLQIREENGSTEALTGMQETFVKEMEFQAILALHYYNKIPEAINLQNEKAYLAYGSGGSSPILVGHIALGLW